MPIYEYECEACGHRLTAAGFRLKGTGWYATDFRDKGKKPAAKDSGAKAAPGKPAPAKGGSGSD